MLLEAPKQVLLEIQPDYHDICDVIVEMDSGKLYTATFITTPFLQRQMRLSYVMGQQMRDVPTVRYAALETPHIVVEDLQRDTIEDTIDNLLALDVFETYFTLVTEDEDAMTTQPTTTGKRATTEVAAVVLSDVLVVNG